MATEQTEQRIAGDGVWITGPDGDLIPDYESTFPTINEGEVVHGTVVRVDKDEVLVDIGYKSEGVIPLSELSIRRSVNPEDEVQVGEEVDALVLTKEDAEGRLILSKKRARFELAWKMIEQKAESGEAIIGRVEMEYSYAELAEVLGKPTADAARKAARRALLRLAEEMK